MAWVAEAFKVSWRCACRTTGVHRSLVACRARKPPQPALQARLRELAQARVSFGYLRLHTLPVREGWLVNRKRVHRFYREEGLQLRVKRPRRRSAVARAPRVVPTAPNQVWAMDFVHDTLANGRTIGVLTLIDSHTRECLTLAAAARFPVDDVVRVVGAVGALRGLPARITMDNGTEFTSKALDA